MNFKTLRLLSFLSNFLYTWQARYEDQFELGLRIFHDTLKFTSLQNLLKIDVWAFSVTHAHFLAKIYIGYFFKILLSSSRKWSIKYSGTLRGLRVNLRGLAGPHPFVGKNWSCLIRQLKSRIFSQFLLHRVAYDLERLFNLTYQAYSVILSGVAESHLFAREN